MFRGNDYDSGWVPLDAIERIEIVRGPMSSLYGSDVSAKRTPHGGCGDEGVETWSLPTNVGVNFCVCDYA